MAEDFQEAVDFANASNAELGRVVALMQRPSEGVHVPVERLYFDETGGIEGDRWRETAWLRLEDGSPDPRVQVSVTNAQVIQVFTGPEPDSIYGCGDNLYLDFNLTEANLVAGDFLLIGEVRLKLSDVINDACGKFSQRFGLKAFRMIREPANQSYHLRGRFCSIEKSGYISIGDAVRKLPNRL
ncbi:MAG: hypothetical protein AAGC73_04025 [Verrucomicrobiota bacterium]